MLPKRASTRGLVAALMMLAVGLVALPAFAADGDPEATGLRAAYQSLPGWAQELLPIGLLLLVIVIVIRRLPRVDVGHSDAFRRRRALNWLPLGLTYAFLYMGRYNLTAVKDSGLISGGDFGTIFAVGTVVYGLSFVKNGPLTDRWGGRATILISAIGSALMNLGMGIVLWTEMDDPTLALSILYGANMYFQSFGAVSIVKVNSAWFHIRERGVFGGIFGILISLGIYFAFDWGHRIVKELPVWWVCLIPAAILAVFAVIDYFLVFNTPSETGHDDFDPGDASSGDDGPRLPAMVVMKRMLSNPIILTIAAVEFCSGYLRNAIMHWYRDFAKGVTASGEAALTESFVYENWGMLLCMAGILGGVFAGIISDRVFDSRRGPVATVLYAMMVLGAIALIPLMALPPAVGWTVIFMSMAIIGVHGMLSGTASQDFGGRKNAGTAVGIIDGFVYLGVALHAVVLGNLLPEKGTAEAADLSSWDVWPLAMLPLAVIGLLLATRVWNARATSARR